MYTKDPYQVMGLTPTASDEEIKTRYRELTRKYHPDNYAGADQTLIDLANEKFTDVQGAYKEIMDRRALGDYTGGARGQQSGSYNSNPNQGSYNGNPYGQGGNPYGNQNQPYQQNYQNYGNSYGRPARYNGGDGCGCGTGNICCDLWCADTLCECMGGNLCGCM